MRDRGWRRAQRRRAIEAARGRARIIGISAGALEMWARTSATAPHPCSAACCGNPRAHGQGRAIAEIWPRTDEVWD